MTSFRHKQLIDMILNIDEIPQPEPDFANWIKADRHIDLLSTNAQSQEIILYASGPYTFICSLVVLNDELYPLDKRDLLNWSGMLPSSHIAGYAHGGGRPDMWIDLRGSEHGSRTLTHGRDLVFRREFEGWSGSDKSYFELRQEFSHLSDIHWRPEHRSYCCYDENGDLDKVVSITRDDRGVSLITCTWPKLEEYLAVSKSSLVRMYDFTLLRHMGFIHWTQGTELLVEPMPGMFYRHNNIGTAAYTRGVQIVGPRRSALDIAQSIKNRWGGSKNTQYVEYIAHDWRNNRIVKISTQPEQTTNYFNTEDNDLPFELSPAFFRPEVLSKYKTDRDKYKLGDRRIDCRSSWALRGYDVNEAGQVHAYICDLRDLPFAEQLHWLSFNEEPKTTISGRAFANDFLGKFVAFDHPKEAIISTARRWDREKSCWWSLRDEPLLDRINPPLTSSKDEWAQAFMDLSQLVIEGFEVKYLRKLLQQKKLSFDQTDQSLRLLERLIAHAEGLDLSQFSLRGLRAIQAIRSKVKGHAGTTDGKQIAEQATSSHGSFSDHFRHVCEEVVAELEMIERACE